MKLPWVRPEITMVSTSMLDPSICGEGEVGKFVAWIIEQQNLAWNEKLRAWEEGVDLDIEVIKELARRVLERLFADKRSLNVDECELYEYLGLIKVSSERFRHGWGRRT